MSKLNRMFDIIQILRGATAPVIALEMAQLLEVTERTIYRDIAALQATGTPIEGASGLGYVMRRGYDLPPLSFDKEEAEAIRLGLSMIARLGDASLTRSAASAARKLSEIPTVSAGIITTPWGIELPKHIQISEFRSAIDEGRTLSLTYKNEAGDTSTRTALPLTLILYDDRAILAPIATLSPIFAISASTVSNFTR